MNRLAYIFWKYKFDHILFWLFTIIFFMYTRRYLIDKAGWYQFSLEILVRNGLLAIIVYINLFTGLSLLKAKKYFGFVLLLIALLLFYTVSKNLHDEYLFNYASKTNAGISFWMYTYYNFSTALFYLGFTMALQFSKEWFYQRDHFQKLKIENLNSEIKYLKDQINPHFLFNSLNTLYVQIDETNADARQTLEKISGMLRYQLYECNNEKISIEKELAYIENYIDLQKLRKEKTFNINFTYDCAVKSFEIAPLLFIPFIENAFKHSSAFKTEPNIVDVSIKKINGDVVLNVMNTISQTSKTNEGIGLINVKRRLDLLYANRYKLLIDKQPTLFKVTLSIALS
jgi:two-component system LytT family sensor kinase